MTSNFRIFLLVLSLFFLAAHCHPASEATSIESNAIKHVLEPRAKRVWTAAEDEHLLALKNEGVPWSEITTRFPDRTYAAISQRYYLLTKDPTAPGKAIDRRWRPREEEILREQEAAGKSVKEIAEYLPGRTVNAIRAKLYQLRKPGRAPPEIARPRWKPEEIQTLRDALEAGLSFKEISQKLGRSVQAVGVKANLSGLRSPLRGDDWTSDEVAFLRQAVGEGMSSKEIARRLGRSKAAVDNKRQVLRKKGQL